MNGYSWSRWRYIDGTGCSPYHNSITAKTTSGLDCECQATASVTLMGGGPHSAEPGAVMEQRGSCDGAVTAVLHPAPSPTRSVQARAEMARAEMARAEMAARGLAGLAGYVQDSDSEALQEGCRTVQSARREGASHTAARTHTRAAP